MADLTPAAGPAPSGITLQRLLHSARLQTAALVLAMASFIGVGLMAASHVNASIDDLLAATVRARLRANAANDVLSALRDAETGQRGFLLTGRLSYLEPYYDAIGHIDGLLDGLGTLMIDLPEFRDDFTALAAAVHSKTAELRRTVILAERDGIPAALAVVNNDEGRVAMDEARRCIAVIVAQSELERDRRSRALTGRERDVTATLLACLGAAVALLGAAALTLQLNRARLLRARSGEQREAARLKAAVEHVRDGIAVFDRDDALILANTRFPEALGIGPDLVVPGTAFATVAAAVTLDPPVLTGTRPSGPQALEAREGARSLEVWRSPMPEGGQMLSVADVTRRVAAEEAARQSQKMDVLGQMTGGVAHDFNNLLQVVSANLELLRSRIERSVPMNDGLLARLDAASAGVARGTRLTRHLLAFARRQPLAPEPLDARRLLMGMEEVLRRTLGEAVEFELVIGGGLWFMRADQTQFENALLNLALNARDAMTRPDGLAGGKFTIEASNAALDEAYVARDADVSPGQYLVFAVSDTGAGMTPVQLARAVEPFYTTKAEGRGTGLGLSMILGFAKQSGGHFKLYSELGHGTTARLYIPRSSAPQARAATAAAGLPLGQNELVLLVEDDPGVRQVSRDALHTLNYQVVEAENADAALALLEGGCRPNLLFTDVVMPGRMSARQLAAAAQALLPGLAVLFTSGYTQNSIVHNGQLDADVALISKPWQRDDLARAVRDALRGVALRPAPRRRVLLVEDEELVRMTTADALAELGFDVLEASSATAALQRLDPPPDLLLTDLGLPDRDGLSLVAEIRDRLPGLPVVVASGQSEPPTDAVVWLSKPYDVASLRRAVTEALS